MSIDYAQLRGKYVLVTGGAGFLGSHLSRRLAELGAHVVILDNFTTGSFSKLEDQFPDEDLKSPAFQENGFWRRPFIQRVSFHTLSGGGWDKAPAGGSQEFIVIAGDANSASDVEFTFNLRKIDYVFHWAAVVGVKRTLENPLAVLRDSEGTTHLLNQCVKHRVTKMVYASSSEVYGDPLELPEREDGAVNAKHPYAVVKLMGELKLKAYAEKYGLRTTSLRFFNVYGPNQENSEYGFVGAVFVRQVLSGQPPTVFGDGTDTRDFVYVTDNVEACVRSALSESADGEVINIGTGRPTTILDLAEKVIAISGSHLTPAFLPPREVEVHHRWPQVVKLRELLDYRCGITLEEGLKRSIEDFKRKKD